MRSRFILQVLLAGALVVVACSDDTASTTAATAAPAATTPSATTQAPAATTAITQAPVVTTAPTTTGLQIVQVGFDTSFQEGWVLLQNTGSTSVAIGGYFLCQRPSYFALPDVTIPAGDVLWIGVAGPVDAQPTFGANGAIGSFDPSGGEVGLYSSNSFEDANSMLSYVEWGSTGHGRSSVAVNAGIWGAGDFVPVLGSLTGAIIVIESAAPPGAGNWEELEAP
jgi:hypothetical protein